MLVSEPQGGTSRTDLSLGRGSGWAVCARGVRRWQGVVRTTRQARLGDLEVRVVRREDDRHVARLKGRARREVGLWVDNVVGGPSLHPARVDSRVHVAEDALHVRANLWQLPPVCSAHAQAAHLAPSLQIQHD